MIDFRLQEKALKVMMAKRLFEQTEESWKILPRYYMNETGSKNLLFHLKCQPEPYILEKMNIPVYYMHLLKSWHACKPKKEPDLTSTRVLREQIIWCNDKIRFKGKMLWFKGWINSGIVYINDVVDELGNFKEQGLFAILKNKTNIMSEMHMLKNAIPTDWKLHMQHDPCKLYVKPLLTPTLYINGKLVNIDAIDSSRQVYFWLVTLNKRVPCTQLYWREMFQDKNIIWTNVYKEKLKNVSEQKIVAFNFKLLHNIIATPHKLYKWKVIESNTCHLCFNEGTLEHMMLKCPYFCKYYEHVKLAFNEIGYENVNIDMYTLICGYKPDIVEYNTINLILNIVFFNVYKCWIKVKIDRQYTDPIQNLYYELNNRCQTKAYCNDLFHQFTNIIKM